ncbi:MAG: hypothetical protein RLZZ618_1923 [Pseudomonadota bacterium]|jgi:signal transduction histidine kinase/ActR/RegA family two-component response regulator
MMRRQIPLRRRLFLLVAAGIVPLALSAGFGLLALVTQQRNEMRTAALDIARALSTAVDSELRRAAAVLDVLATSTELDAGDPKAFLPRAQRVLASQPDWRLIMVADPLGEVLAHTATSLGAKPPPIVDRQSFVTAVRTQKSVVGHVAKGPKGDFAFAVRTPVMHNGQLLYVLTGALRPKVILDVIQRQHVPSGWVVAVLDSGGNRVARSRANDESMGQPPTPSLRELLLSKADEDTGITLSLEGDPVYTAFHRLPDSRWTVAIGIPTAELEAGAWKSLLAYGGGIVLSFLLATLAALAVARSINRPIGELREAALALGSGTPPPAVVSDIQEVQAVADALLTAASQRSTNETERESLLDAERRSRAAVEAARRRLELLATAGSVLSRSLEPHATLEAIASIMVPSVADWCRVDLLDSEGQLQQVLMHHVDPERARQGAEMLRRLPARSELRGSPAWSAAEGKPHRWQVDTSAHSLRDPALQEFVDFIGLRVSYVVPLIARGRTLGALAALQGESGRDLTDDDCALIAQLAQRAALALDNARLYAEAGSTRKQAEMANRTKDEFLAMLGHELRNPLAPIVTSLHLMNRRNDDGSARERGIIGRQVAHLMRLVDDLLDVSRITQGKIQLQLSPIDLNAVVARAIEMTHPVFEKRIRPVEMQIPDEPLFVMGDEVRLAQVLSNLLTNAAKFTPGSGRIALTLTHDNVEATLVVEDSGSGMAPTLLPHVFDLFTQGQQSIDRHAGGLGLGLAIVRTLVKMHGGTVTAESEGLGFGSRFTVRLPLVERPEVSALAPSTISSALDARRRSRVLLVDDNGDAASTLAELLEVEGYDTRVCGDAPAAFRVLETFTPDLALLDIGLPGMDGHELARKLKASPRTAHTTLIALTGYGSSRDRDLALAAGFTDHLVKPVDPEKLLKLLGRLSARPA